MHNPHLANLIGTQQIGIAAAYATDATQVYICGVEILADESLSLYFPKGHQFQPQQKITIHLDNRTGVSEYDEELLVYRTSYKGIVTQANTNYLKVVPQHFEVWYGTSIVHSFNSPTYSHAPDNRPDLPLKVTPLTELPIPDMCENDNKIGVLVTQAVNQPHTTVFAFLSTACDDIFFITFPNTFKSQLLKREPYCHFAIDSRATLTYTEALDWNYSIIEADVFSVPPEHQFFEPIRELFIQKNPWEVGFFSAPNLEMYHLKARRIIMPT